MDKKYNESWVVVIGEGFSFEGTHQVCVLWMYTSNSVAVLVTRVRPPPSPLSPAAAAAAAHSRAPAAARPAAPAAPDAAPDAAPAAAARLPAAHQSPRVSLSRRAAGARQTGA